MSEDVEITHDEARDESRCGLFCDEEPDVSFEAFGYTFHRCQSCYEEPCSRCGEEIEEDSNKPKGWCQSCREEIRLICGGDEERGIKKDEDSEQTTLMTDGGRAEYDREDKHTVEFLTGREVAAVDDDPVLERRDFWRGSL